MPASLFNFIKSPGLDAARRWRAAKENKHAAKENKHACLFSDFARPEAPPRWNWFPRPYRTWGFCVYDAKAGEGTRKFCVVDAKPGARRPQISLFYNYLKNGKVLGVSSH